MKTTAIRIRAATASDIPGLVLMGGEFFQHTGYTERGLKCDPFHLHRFLENAIADDNYAVMVADADGQLVGCIGASAGATYFTPQLIASELFWWMDPQARNSRAALQLLKALEQWAMDKGCTLLAMVDIALMTSNAPHIYQRKGYQLAERSWIKTLKE